MTLNTAATPDPNGASAPRHTPLSDGEWHRLHPATPLLRGGVALIAVISILAANLRDRILELWIGVRDSGDPVTLLADRGLLAPAVAIVGAALLVGLAAFWVAWRAHSFRITDEVVEVRSGILFRTHRKARLDRIQGINIVRPFVARLVGAARLEVTVAGHDANVRLAYLGSAAADLLRRDVLALASGASRAGAAESRSAFSLQRRIGELIAPEFDASTLAPESVVRIPAGRLAGSILFSGFTLIVLAVGGVALPLSLVHGNFFWLFAAGPGLLGVVSFYLNRIAKSLRYSISGSPDGIRIGFGLLSLSNETLPPGRIHAVRVSQPPLWRPFGWWQISVNLASNSNVDGAAGQANTTILPVGDRRDVQRVLELALPALGPTDGERLLNDGMFGRGSGDGFISVPRRAAWLRPLSWRRSGVHLTDSAVLLRRGALWRSLVVVPAARVQSISLHQGPILRWLNLAEFRVQTVAGPITARLGGLDRVAAQALFERARQVAVAAARADTSHRWHVAQTGATDVVG